MNLLAPPPSGLRQIRASAGSGKTYELTTSFLTFLAGAQNREAVSGCGAPVPGAHAWPEILAVTFTNRAAAEMQERIIGRLKDTALGIGEPAPGWTREQAARWIAIILRRYGSLNVRTIDSLLHLIVRLAALELDLPPDFEPVFATEDALAPLLDAVLEQTRTDPRMYAVLEDACRNVLFHSKHRGFMVGGTLRKKVLALLLTVMGTRDLARPHDVAAHLGIMLTELRNNAERISRQLETENLSASAYFSKALVRCGTDMDADLPPNSTMLRKDTLDECLLKASRGKASDIAEALFFRLRDTVDKLDSDGVLLRRALTVMPFVELAREVVEQLPDFLKREGTMPADFVPRLAHQILSGEYGVSEAFCRLGTSLTHILIDEFQDTSRDQWHAIHPLVLEALSRGGSLTWVGDVKQAIYGWRGGDATLFDEVLHDPELSAVAPDVRVDPLPTNWRSCRAIVTTNNKIFSKLAEIDVSRSVLSAMLPRDTPLDVREAILETEAHLLRDGFKDAGQSLSAGKGEGFLHLQRIHGEEKEDLDEQVREHLLDCLDDLATRRAWGDVTVLVRSNVRAAQVAGWLMSEGIPVVTENSFLLAEHPLIIQLTGLLSFLDSPRDELAFWTFLSGQLLLPLTGLTPQILNDWAVSQRKGKRGRMPLYLAFKDAFPAVWKTWLAPFHADAGLLSPYDATREALERLDMWRRFPGEAAFVRRFLEVLHVAEGQGFGSLSTFLEYWNRKDQQEKAPMPENLDAVRVMTIHKSKGLQFPVVIVPWHNGTLHADSPAVETLVDGLHILTPRGSASGMEHYQAIADVAREALHLFYVAWTRPEEELHAFLTETDTTASVGFSGALDILIDQPFLPDGSYTLGTPTQSAHSARNASATGLCVSDNTQTDTLPVPTDAQKDEDPAPVAGDAHWRPMHWLPRLRIFRNPLEDFAFTQKRRGIFVHHCLACLHLSGRLTDNPEADARRIVEQALRTFPLPIREPEVVEREIVTMLIWYAGLPEAALWLRHGTPEQEVVDEHGDLHRADLVVDDGQSFTIVEYKTGAPTPAHETQLQRYLNLIGKAVSRPVQGVLVYLDLQRLEYRRSTRENITIRNSRPDQD